MFNIPLQAIILVLPFLENDITINVTLDNLVLIVKKINTIIMKKEVLFNVIGRE